MKIKTYTKKNKKLASNLSLLGRPFAYEIAGIYRRNTEGNGV